MINDFESTKNLNKIKSIGTFVRLLAVIGVTVFVIVQALGNVSVNFSNGGPASFEIGKTSRSVTRILAELPYQLSVLGAFYWVFRLFGGFRKGDIFTDFSVKAFRLLAICVVFVGVNGLLLGFYKGALDFLFTAGRTIQFDVYVDNTDFAMMGFGLLLYAVALVQREAKSRTEDLKLIF